ncbi:hypothetical protein EDD29_4448 [Actinocorallia herbida]|uniref:Secreted protein n=1 Tax=Actinocorallia herbida TaxID=58109 RepID=A0A3N1D050_9ACTN|nr:hypothetical protein [Actinocorallia herbida]ROO86866.1 hypothetical protein EDD29_4448 [Actinocorallia herbida]
MRRLRKASSLTAATAACVLAFSGGAQAATFTPGPADFANCPTLPSGATKALWQCVSVVLTNGSFKLGSRLNISIGGPIRLNAAVGIHNGKIATATGSGGSGSSTPGGDIPGIGAFSVQIQQAGPLVVDGLVPKTIPIKIHVTGPLLGGSCYLGSDSDPINLTPTVSGLKLQQSNGTPYVSATIAEKTFNVPASTGCGLGGILSALVNSFLGLPSPSGSNAVSIDAALQAKNYAFGNITNTLAATALSS